MENWKLSTSYSRVNKVQMYISEVYNMHIMYWPLVNKLKVKIYVRYLFVYLFIDATFVTILVLPNSLGDCLILYSLKCIHMPTLNKDYFTFLDLKSSWSIVLLHCLSLGLT